MNQRRIGDILLDVTAILIGITPLGLVLTGRGHLIAGYDVISGTLNTVLVVVLIFCGLIFAVAGANAVINGRSESESHSLY